MVFHVFGRLYGDRNDHGRQCRLLSGSVRRNFVRLDLKGDAWCYADADGVIQKICGNGSTENVIILIPQGIWLLMIHGLTDVM